jgi:hypothetical protein
MEKIKDFIYTSNPKLTYEENLKIQNRSNHDNIVHLTLFRFIDQFSKKIIKDLHNLYASKLFESNQLTLISDEKEFEALIIPCLKNQGYQVKGLANPEIIYRAINFLKPFNLLPEYDTKLYLIKQLGITESGKQYTFLLNPFFFGFKICFDIFINSLFCSDHDETIEDSLIKILVDMYGVEYKDMYEYVSYVSNNSAIEGKRKGDKNDETFIAGVKAISGINNNKIFYNFIYEPALLTASSNARILKGE